MDQFLGAQPMAYTVRTADYRYVEWRVLGGQTNVSNLMRFIVGAQNR